MTLVSGCADAAPDWNPETRNPGTLGRGSVLMGYPARENT
jgi:hypothetical protein